MRVLKTLVKCIIILVVLFLLADWFASVIDGDVFIGFLLVVIIAITIASIIKPDKFD